MRRTEDTLGRSALTPGAGYGVLHQAAAPTARVHASIQRLPTPRRTALLRDIYAQPKTIYVVFTSGARPAPGAHRESRDPSRNAGSSAPIALRSIRPITPANRPETSAGQRDDLGHETSKGCDPEPSICIAASAWKLDVRRWRSVCASTASSRGGWVCVGHEAKSSLAIGFLDPQKPIRRSPIRP
jgi:hypothetical protein